MKDLQRCSCLAALFIVLLRMSIGWQFLYEGLWKKDTLSGPDPWTSEGYLKNAQGPFRHYFRNMTGDPDDLKWLDYADMSGRWYAWRDRFVSHYKLDEAQTKALNVLLDGSADQDTAPSEDPPAVTTRQALAALPAGIDPKKLGESVKYDAEKKQLVATQPLLPSEEAALLDLADAAKQPDGSLKKKSNPAQNPDAADLDYLRGVERLAAASRQLSYRARLAGALRGNPDAVGVIGEVNPRGTFDFVMGTVTASEAGPDKNNIRYGKIQEYKDLLVDYNAALDRAKMDYQYGHATMLGRKVAIMRAELAGPIKALDSGFKQAAFDLLRTEQLQAGALPPENTPLAKSDRQVMWGLIVLGSLLIVGLFTRAAAVLGAAMLFMFYLVMPPWPGVPPIPGPEHSFIVNKNLIECVALLVIAALPTGSWFGIDALLRGVCVRCCGGKRCAAPPATAPAPKI